MTEKAVSFVIKGQCPSKGNYRHVKPWKVPKGRQHPWTRIKNFEAEVAKKGMGLKPAARRAGCRGEPTLVRTICVNQRADAGNVSKGVLDALEGIYYNNDKLIGDDARPVKDPEQEAHVRVEIVWQD